MKEDLKEFKLEVEEKAEWTGKDPEENEKYFDIGQSKREIIIDN
jgi:hypothetical protein